MDEQQYGWKIVMDETQSKSESKVITRKTSYAHKKSFCEIRVMRRKTFYVKKKYSVENELWG